MTALLRWLLPFSLSIPMARAYLVSPFYLLNTDRLCYPDHPTIFSSLQLLSISALPAMQTHLITLFWYWKPKIKFRCLNLPMRWAVCYLLHVLSPTSLLPIPFLPLPAPKGPQDFSCLHWLFRPTDSSTQNPPAANSSSSSSCLCSNVTSSEKASLARR